MSGGCDTNDDDWFVTNNQIYIDLYIYIFIYPDSNGDGLRIISLFLIKKFNGNLTALTGTMVSFWNFPAFSPYLTV